MPLAGLLDRRFKAPGYYERLHKTWVLGLLEMEAALLLPS